MTYQINLNHTSDPILNPSISELNSFFNVAPTYHYGATGEFDCDTSHTCFLEMAEDFAKLKSLNFNTLRISFGFQWNPEKSQKDDKFYTRSIKDCGDLNNCWKDSDYVEVNKPYSTSPILNFKLSKMDSIINIATSAPFNFKIILALETAASKINPQSAHANDFDSLLIYITNHYKTNTSIISYSIASEPRYSEIGARKFQVCDWTTQWYDAIKTVDTNHLITTSGHIQDVIFWDPSIIKSDYFEVHSYPDLAKYEKETVSYDLASAAINRFQGSMYWYRNYCPKPVMVGETGFRASDFQSDSLYPQDSLYYDGNLNQQFDYAKQTFQITRDCEALGYNWWNYQDDWNYIEIGYGLIHHGAIPSNPPNLYDKPVASVFDTIPQPGICSKPSNYFDPYNCGLFNTSHVNAVKGRLVDSDGNPIKGGIVEGQNWLYNVDDPDSPTPRDTGDDKQFQTWYYYYANDSGYFEIIPYNYINLNLDRIVYVRGSAPGAEKFERGIYDTYLQMPTGLNEIILKKLIFQYDGVFNNVNINHNDLKGWNSVNVNNSTIQGTSNITAREEINIRNESRLYSGEVHVYTSETMLDCNLTSDFFRLSKSGIFSNNSVIPGQKQIEIDFNLKNSLNFSILPNPNNGIFHLELSNYENVPVTISVISPIGNEYKKIETLEKIALLDLSTLSNGIYLVVVLEGNKKAVKKLIINK